ncbi:MAG: response regulator transcription factor [Nocardioides sp.]
MAARAHLLLVEDDLDLQLTTRLVLEQRGFEVSVAGDGLEALDRLRNEEFDLAVLDVMLPGLDGIRLTTKVREFSEIPIVMLTARDLPHDEVQGLRSGADDYVMKPFDGDVLAARLEAVLRRRSVTAPEPASAIVKVGEIALDPLGMTVEVAGEPVAVTVTEFRLLAAFMAHPGMVLSRQQLLTLAWGESEWIDPRVVDVNVQRVRAKVGADALVTIRGAGYKLVRPGRP